MKRFASLALSTGDIEVNFLGVMKVAFDIKHAVFALVTTNGNVSVMQRLSRNGGCGKWHVKSLMNQKLSIIQK